MDHTTYASRLRFLAAGDVDATVVDYDGLQVEGPDGDRIGDVAGFIVDAQAGRLHFVVVDSGGWFRSRRFLLPVGHASLSEDPKALCVDVTRSALSRYPAFDANRFREFSDDDMALFETWMAEVCCPDVPAEPTFGAQRHYAQPNWWSSTTYTYERLRPVEADYELLELAGSSAQLAQ